MILITSGAYLDNEFVSEVGFLPPSFLPIGNKRLFQHQISWLRKTYGKSRDYYISIPESYLMEEVDEKIISHFDFEIIRIPEPLSLGASILYAWNSVGKNYDELIILHGDTLLSTASQLMPDSMSAHEDEGTYRRAVVESSSDRQSVLNSSWSNQRNLVLSGHFRLSSPLRFMRHLVRPNCDFVTALANYNEEKVLNLNRSGTWSDFGHINSYFRSRAKFTTERSFNQLNIKHGVVIKKSSSMREKLQAEYRWFSNIPSKLRRYTPATLQAYENKTAEFVYETEYLSFLPLNDLYVYGALPQTEWENIFRSVAHMLVEFKSIKPTAQTLNGAARYDSLYLEKTLNRLGQISDTPQQAILESESNMKISQLIEMAEDSSRYIAKVTPTEIGIMHGDLCFSNILYDSRTGNVKCIDPRGQAASGGQGVFGDVRYDMAKLFHSVYGLYDHIVAERVNKADLVKGDPISNFVQLKPIIEIFDVLILDRFQYDKKLLLAMNVHLFLSMLPLHSDNIPRQAALALNARRLYRMLVEEEE